MASPFFQTSAPDPDSSGTQLLSVEASTALTCVPGWGVTLLGLAQPPLIPGVGKVNEQDQLYEDEEEGAHDAKVEPDCGERAMRQVTGGVGAAVGTAGPQGCKHGFTQVFSLKHTGSFESHSCRTLHGEHEEKQSPPLLVWLSRVQARWSPTRSFPKASKPSTRMLSSEENREDRQPPGVSVMSGQRATHTLPPTPPPSLPLPCPQSHLLLGKEPSGM